MRRSFSSGLFVVAALATFVAGCNSELKDERILKSQLPGIYEGIDVPAPVGVSAEALPAAATAEFELIQITSIGELKGRLLGEDGENFLLSGELSGSFDPDGNLTNASGNLDVWFEELGDDPMQPGPHAVAKVLSADLSGVEVDGEIIEKTLLFELDFTAVDGQLSGLADAAFDDYDGDYAVEASQSEIRIYDDEATYERTWGEAWNWKDEGKGIRLAELDADISGETYVSIDFDTTDYAVWCDEYGRYIGDPGDGFIDPYDRIVKRSPRKNTYLIQGEATCNDGVGVMAYEGFGFVSEDDNDDGDERIKLWVEMVLSTPGEDDAHLMAEWVVYDPVQTITLSVNNDYDYVDAGQTVSGELEFDVTSAGADVTQPYEVEVIFDEANFSSDACEDILDLTPQTISCPLTPGLCDPVTVPYTDFVADPNAVCSFDVRIDAGPAFINDSDSGIGSVSEIGVCSLGVFAQC